MQDPLGNSGLGEITGLTQPDAKFSIGGPVSLESYLLPKCYGGTSIGQTFPFLKGDTGRNQELSVPSKSSREESTQFQGLRGSLRSDALPSAPASEPRFSPLEREYVLAADLSRLRTTWGGRILGGPLF